MFSSREGVKKIDILSGYMNMYKKGEKHFFLPKELRGEGGGDVQSLGDMSPKK